MNSVMPDIAHSTLPQAPRKLERVGMTRVDVPIMTQAAGTLVASSLTSNMVPAQAGGFVNLSDPTARGIHMSRIYRIIAGDLPQRPISFEHISVLLDKLLETHQGISESAELIVNYSHLAAMPALLSGLEGWRRYPVFYRGYKERNGNTVLDFGIRVTYSSTCPCSAALARQLNQKRFIETFGEAGSTTNKTIADWLDEELSTGGEPHAQRSHGIVVLRYTNPATLPTVESLAAHLESHLGTPVQTAVKREDEQEFARLNARNLMFSEDAARKLAKSIEGYPCSDFMAHVTHFESLHPYDVQATATKGIPGGLSARDIESVIALVEGNAG